MTRRAAPSNRDDVIDSRDIIARIAELEAEIQAGEVSEDNGAEPQVDDNGNTIVRTSTCGECGKSWNDALISERTPAPSARCPYEYLHEEIAESATLKALEEEASGSADWTHGETLIADRYFTEYARQLAEDIGAINSDAGWPARCIDWEQAASELQADYTSVEFGDVTYWIRS